MALTQQDVRRIAALARIELDEAASAHMLGQLNDVLHLIERLQAVDTTGVEPMTHPHAGPLRLREDEATEPDRRADFQAGAPAVEDGLYLVPKVIE